MTRSVAVALLLLAGCTAEPSREVHPTPSPATTSASPSPSVSCPPAPRAAARPSGVPRALPWPPGARVVRAQRTESTYSVRGTAHGALPSMPGWLVREMRAAGFELGRGDASATEVTAPFTRGSVRGLYRFFASAQPCELVFVLTLTA